MVLFDPQAVRSAAAWDDFSEVGGAAALSVFGRSYDVGTVTAGLRWCAACRATIGRCNADVVRTDHKRP